MFQLNDIKDHFESVKENFPQYDIKYYACVGNVNGEKLSLRIHYSCVSKDDSMTSLPEYPLMFSVSFVTSAVDKIDNVLQTFNEFLDTLISELFDDKERNRFVCFRNYKNVKASLLCKDEWITSWIDKKHFFSKDVDLIASLITGKGGAPTTFVNCVFNGVKGGHILSVIGHISEEIMDLLPDSVISEIFNYFKEEEEYIKRSRMVVSSFRECIGEKYRLLYETKI